MRILSPGQRRAALSVALSLVLFGTVATASAGTIPLFRLFRNPFAAQVAPTNPPPGTFDATCAFAGIPQSVTINQYFTFVALVGNTGTATWNSTVASSAVRVAAPTNLWWRTTATFLYYIQNPGDTGVATLAVRAPSTPGTYTLEWQAQKVATGARFGQVCRQDLVVTRMPTVTNLRASPPGSSRVGQTVNFQATTTPVGGTGTVILKEGTGVLATSPVGRDGYALVMWRINTLPVGTHILTASYTGDVRYFPSDSQPLTYVITASSSSSSRSSSTSSRTSSSSSRSSTIDRICCNSGYCGMGSCSTGYPSMSACQAVCGGSSSRSSSTSSRSSSSWNSSASSYSSWHSSSFSSSASGSTVGNLFVTQDPTPIRNHQFLGGTLGETILRVNFHAENEDIDVTKLMFVVGGVSQSVDRFELYLPGATTPFAFATVAGCAGENVGQNVFCSTMISQQLVVPNGLNTVVLLRPRIKSDQDGGLSGAPLQINVMQFTGVWSVIQARGVQTSRNLAKNNNDTVATGEVFIGRNNPGSDQQIVGVNHRIVMAKLTSIVNANPDTNGTALVAGMKTVGIFNIAAAANNNTRNGLNKVRPGNFYFNLASSNVTMDAGSFAGYSLGNPTTTIPCTARSSNGSVLQGAASGSFLVLCAFSGSVVSTDIDSGTNRSIALRVTIQNPKVSVSQHSNLLVSLQAFSNAASLSFGPAASHFSWQDVDNGGAQGFLWVDYPDTIVNGTLYSY